MFAGTGTPNPCPLRICYSDIKNETEVLNMWEMKERKKQNFKKDRFNQIQ
jgi:hypothetical protein